MARNHVVYKHTLNNDGRVYIGQTWRTSIRWADDGALYKTCPRFWAAIQKYGWQSFNHEIVFDNLSKEEADIVERVLIKHYDSTNPEKGFNTTYGGAGCFMKNRNDDSYHNRFERPVTKYSLNGKQIANYDSVDDAEQKTGIMYTSIYKCCVGNHAFTAGGFRWAFKGEKLKPLPKNRGVRKRIEQQSLNGTVVAIYDSLSEASRHTGISTSLISLASRGKSEQAGGYKWILI